jgi:hypothetical protein
MFVNCFIGWWLVCAPAGSPSPSRPVASGTSQEEKSVPPKLNLVLSDSRAGLIYQVGLVAEATEGRAFESGEGVWLRGTGRATSVDGNIAIEELTVAFRVKARVRPERVLELGGSSVCAFGRDGPIDYLQFGPALDTKTQDFALVSYSRTCFATGQLNETWRSLLDPVQTAAVLADVQRLLTSTQDDRDVEPGCNPTFTQCQTAACEACAPYGVLTLGYSCNPQTGEVHCDYTCKTGGR